MAEISSRGTETVGRRAAGTNARATVAGAAGDDFRMGNYPAGCRKTDPPLNLRCGASWIRPHLAGDCGMSVRERARSTARCDGRAEAGCTRRRLRVRHAGKRAGGWATIRRTAASGHCTETMWWYANDASNVWATSQRRVARQVPSCDSIGRCNTAVRWSIARATVRCSRGLWFIGRATDW